MAIIDSLLALQRSQRAKALIIATGQVPMLEMGGAQRSLSMPPLDDDTVANLLRELDGGMLDEELAQHGRVAMSYEPAGGPRYDVSISASGSSIAMTFCPAPSGERAQQDPAGPAHTPAVVPEAPARQPAEAPTFTGLDLRLASLLTRAADMGCEDVILSTSSPPRGRLEGRIHPLDTSPVRQDDIDELLRSASSSERTDSLASAGSADFALSLQDASRVVRFRVNVFHHHDGITAVLRPVRSRVPSLRELGLPDDFTSLVSHPQGLVLLTGPACSGKSTTLTALVEHVNLTKHKHIITLEDPIEYLYTRAQCLIHQREVGTHVDGFSGGLRAALRESPDIIVVGEMRDVATMSAALIAAETGHLVLSTLHAGSTTMAVERVIGAFPPHDQAQIRGQLAAVLRAVVAQVLLPGIPPDGRVVAYEKLLINHAAATKIREDRCHQLATVLQSGQAEGMVPFESTLADRVMRGRVRLETALAVCHNADLLRSLVKR
ncbi:MAG: type IV pilus twitching motility protein PilT [Myxococcota bacterium]